MLPRNHGKLGQTPICSIHQVLHQWSCLAAATGPVLCLLHKCLLFPAAKKVTGYGIFMLIALLVVVGSSLIEKLWYWTLKGIQWWKFIPVSSVLSRFLYPKILCHTSDFVLVILGVTVRIRYLEGCTGCLRYTIGTWKQSFFFPQILHLAR